MAKRDAKMIFGAGAIMMLAAVMVMGGAAQSGEALIPVARTSQSDFSSTNRIETGTHYTVPTGKRLVIEVISGKIAVASATRIRSVVTTRTSGGTMNTHLLWLLQSVEGTQNVYAATHSVRLYADAGTKVDITTTRSNLADSGGTSYSFSGHLVNMP